MRLNVVLLGKRSPRQERFNTRLSFGRIENLTANTIIDCNYCVSAGPGKARGHGPRPCGTVLLHYKFLHSVVILNKMKIMKILGDHGSVKRRGEKQKGGTMLSCAVQQHH